MIHWNRRSSGSKKASWARSSSGFNLPELMGVIVIIGILVGIAIPVYINHQATARDRRRLSDIRNVEAALEAYKFENGCYPVSDGSGPGGWETPLDGDFVSALTNEGFMEADVLDPDGPNNNYRYYRYNVPSYGIDDSRGPYYVLGIVDLEKSGRPAEGSDGWCPDGSTRNWQNEFDWVTGCFTDE